MIKLMDFLSRIEFIDKLIRERATGNATTLASKLNISKRTVFNYLKWMKKRGAPIVYSKADGSYIYKREAVFVIAFVSYEIKRIIEELKNQ
ncbi:hypothetical protein C900_05436 [Fulvivirga imtechensis AK7]|uniref:Helix-turn-helix type 11 domain-containing protein n=1 Tax=Fulvivirga imtechensis AK7 TaxID=1237149 RepID=L8JNU3_9BACT|nr:HTH domain-containing protein [Fulvivirga imtechensis]ELR69047.1 hypothetical protein C900_05436 [Fulvivirga imtechensis AK7]